MADSPSSGPPAPPPRGMQTPNLNGGPPLPPRPSQHRRVSETPNPRNVKAPPPMKSSKTMGQFPESALGSPMGSTPPTGPSHGNPPPPVPHRSKRTPIRTPSETSFAATTGGGQYNIMTTPVRHATNPPSVMIQNTPGDQVYVTTQSFTSPPPRSTPVMPSKNSYDNRPIEQQDWYWGNITKEDVTNIMKDMPDGSFLVRDAARVPGYYTLTLRKGGVNRLIRILQKDGLCGFAEPLEFESVMALVAYYRENSLAPYSPKLDITLSNAVSKQMIGGDDFVRMDENTPEQLVEKLHEVETQLHDLSREYNTQKGEFEKTNEDLRKMRIEISAQREIICMLEDGVKEHKKLQQSCPSQHRAKLMSNYETLTRRLRMQNEDCDQLTEKLNRKERTKNSLDMELNNLKPRIKSLQAEKGTILRILNQRGWKHSEIEARLKRIEAGEDLAEEEGLYATYAMLHTYRKDSDYQRISEQLKKQGAAKRPPPWPSHENRSMKTPPRRIHTTDSIGSGPPTPQHQSQAFLNSSLNASPGGGSIPMHPRDRLNTIDIRPQPRMPDGGYDTYDGQLISYKQLNVDRNLPHFDQSTWMNPSISREGSRDILSGRPNGTFLVRQKGPTDEIPTTAPTHSHSIDIVDQGKFKRIPVFRDPRGGYGYAPPYEFDSLLSLVLYYAVHTMEKHSPDLRATLQHPAFSPKHRDQGKFKRIPVFRDPKGGYGFAPPYEFDSLVTLVLYYATNTMEKHNPDLETVLKFPAFTSTL